MFDPSPQLSSDLDWMLQSGQANLETIAQGLVQEYFYPVYRLALSLLEDPRLAHRAAADTFSTALLTVYRYRSDTGVRTWLFRIALQTCTALMRKSSPPPETSSSPAGDETEAALRPIVDGLPTWMRLPVLFHYLLGWPVADIAPVVLAEQRSVQANLNLGRQKLLSLLYGKGIPRQDLEDGDPDARLAALLQKRWPAPELDLADLDQIAAEVLHQAEQRGTHLQRFFSFNEALLVAVAILLAAGLFWGYNRFFPEPEPTQVVAIVSTPTRRPSPTPSPRPTTTPATGFSNISPPTPTPYPEDALYIIQPGDSFSRIASRLNTSIDILLALNRVPNGATPQVGQALFVPGSLPASDVPMPTPVTPAPQTTPLTHLSSPEEMIRRGRQFGQTWNTLWFDTRITFYGPKAYIGPSQNYRLQGWFSRDQVLVLGGPYSPDPHLVMLVIQGENLYLARPGLNQPWFTNPWNNENTNFFQSFFPLYRLFMQVLNPSAEMPFNAVEKTLRVVRSETISGRETIVVDQFSADGIRVARLWFDTLSGIPLRQRAFDEGSGNTMLSETEFTSIAFDSNFPQAQGLFDPRLPWRGGYALNPSGKPIPSGPQPTLPVSRLNPAPLPTRTPPPGFDPSQSQLTFQSPPSYQDPTGRIDFFWDRGRMTVQISKEFNLFNPQSFSTSYPVELLADGYYLGKVKFPDPVNTICSRSPDGKRLAFAPRSFYMDMDYYSFQPSLLRWLNLSSPEEVLNPLVPLQAYEFAFAPDSRRLAIFGADSQSGQRGIYLLDTFSGASSRLAEVDYASSLVWSPDGYNLAFLAVHFEPAQPKTEVVVVRISDGEVTYRSEFSASNGALPTGTPVPYWLPNKWGVDFPVEPGGLDDCAAPPG